MDAPVAAVSTPLTSLKHFTHMFNFSTPSMQRCRESSSVGKTMRLSWKKKELELKRELEM